MDRWQVERPFWWGLLLISDRDTTAVPELGESMVSQSREGLAVTVLHAQDVDISGYADDDVVPPSQVRVEVNVGARAAEDDVSFSGVIDVPSGVLTVGDADEEDALHIGAGHWAVQVDCQPPEHPELVRIWLHRE